MLTAIMFAVSAIALALVVAVIIDTVMTAIFGRKRLCEIYDTLGVIVRAVNVICRVGEFAVTLLSVFGRQRV